MVTMPPNDFLKFNDTNVTISFPNYDKPILFDGNYKLQISLGITGLILASIMGGIGFWLCVTFKDQLAMKVIAISFFILTLVLIIMAITMFVGNTAIFNIIFEPSCWYMLVSGVIIFFGITYILFSYCCQSCNRSFLETRA